jgi:hypothetical protein
MKFRGSFQKLLIFTLGVFTQLLSLNAFAQIEVISAGSYGSGCPNAGSASIQLAPDNTSVTILYNDMKQGLSDRAGTLSIECKSDIDLRIPAGMQLELRHVDYRGYVSLEDPSKRALIRSNVCFKGGSSEIQRNRQPGCQAPGGFGTNFVGPITDEFFFKSGVFTDRAGRALEVRNLSRCNGVAKLRIKTTLGLSSDSGRGLAEIGLDSADFQFSQKYNLFLAPCDKDNQRVERICRQGTCQEYDIR